MLSGAWAVTRCGYSDHWWTRSAQASPGSARVAMRPTWRTLTPEHLGQHSQEPGGRDGRQMGMPDPRAPDPARRAAFEAIVDRVYEPLGHYLRRRCSPDDVDELLDDVLLVLWRRLDDVPAADGAVPWAYGIARRCLANYRRASQRRERLLQRVGATVREPGGPDWMSAAEAALHRSLDRLPEGDREVVRLWAWERLEPREIAAVLDTTPNAVSVRLGRIQRRLSDEMARHDLHAAGQERNGSCEGQGR